MSAAVAIESKPVKVKPWGSGAGWFGAVVLVVFAALALSASSLSPYRPTAPVGAPLESPSAEHLLGTNGVGQDVASQLLSGAQASLLIAVLAGVGTLGLGAVVGVLAGWLGGRVDAVLMRLVDLTLAVPRLPLLIVVGAYLGPSVPAIAAIIALTAWPGTARVTRSQVLSLRSRAHLRAAVGFGASTRHVLGRHVVPELGLILAAGLVSSAGRAVMLEAGLAFLGLGDPTRVSWGATMREALDFNGLFYTSAWMWWLVPPILAVSLVLLGITFLGVALEASINPRLTRHVGAGR